MGSWFSNIHIRTTPETTQDAIQEAISALMTAKGYRHTENAETADTVITLFLPEDSAWITLCGELIAHDDPESCSSLATPLSAQLHTDVLGISCFDSDYLYLNLINADQQFNGWVGIGAGKEVGITRRSNLSVWKKKVTDYPNFSVKAKSKYILADQFLLNVAENLGLSYDQSCFNKENAEINGFCLYFERTAESTQKPRMAHYDPMLPCFMDKIFHVSAVNVGTGGTGLSVYFLGSYVENEEITFSDTAIDCQDYSVPMQLTKERLDDGRWVYSWRDPNFPLPPAVPKRLPKEKRDRLEWEQRITVCFTPSGNARKMLDITVVFVPTENPQGNTQWNVWQNHGSKKAFIEHYNKICKRVRAFEPDPDQWLPYLKEEDFDD